MTVRLSYDEGKTWPIAKTLNPEWSAYSCLAVLPDLSMACLYERGDKGANEKIIFAKFTLDWLTDGKDSVSKDGSQFQKSKSP
jgi:sialidase-1